MSARHASLRYRWLWYSIGAVLTLLVIVSSLVPSHDLPHVYISDKLEHFCAYFGLAVWFGGLLDLRRYFALAVLLLALGGGIEIAQGMMGLGREADWADFGADAVGVATGMLLAYGGLRHWPDWMERWTARK
jgi:VanZ family protein